MKCTIIYLIIFTCEFFASKISTLRCASPHDGLQVEDVRKVIKKCMKKITLDYDSIDSSETLDKNEQKTRSYDEYDEIESIQIRDNNNKDYQTDEREDEYKNIYNPRQNNDRMNNYSKSYSPERYNHNYDYSETGGNYYKMNHRNNRHDPPQYYNPYQFTFNHNHNNNINNQHGKLYGGNGNSQNKNKDNSTIDKNEKDRSCILQCFFQELKMVNDDGFPDRNKMTNVMNSNLRDKELKNFYIDSIQECFRMVNLDQMLLRNNCLYSKKLITCLTERAKMNCVDWNAETVIF